MPAPTKGARLGGSPAHQRLIMANLATQLFEHGRILTTEAKAKRLRPLAEKLITKAKRGDIHSRRLVLTTVRDKGVVHTLFTEIAPSLAERKGGYTRITKVGPRKGDNAPMAMIELVRESVDDSKKANAKGAAPAKKAPARKTAKSASSPTASAAAAIPVAPAASATEPAAADEAPAEKLVDETTNLEEATAAEERPSDDSSAEEAVAVDAAGEDSKTEENKA